MTNPLCGYSLKRGVQIIAVADIILFFVTIISVAVVDKYSNCEFVKLNDFLPDFSIFGNTTKYEVGVLHFKYGISTEEVTTEYLIDFAVAWIVLMSYILLEVWLCCNIIKASKEGNIEKCTSWFWWRLVTLIFSLALLASKDVVEHEIHYSDFCQIPLYFLRIFLLIVVYKFKIELRNKLMLNFNVPARKVSFTSFFAPV